MHFGREWFYANLAMTGIAAFALMMAIKHQKGLEKDIT